MPDVDNNDRADWAEEAVVEFSRITQAEHGAQAFCDLLADMRHLADRWGIDFDKAVERTRNLYEEEIEEDGGKADFDPIEDDENLTDDIKPDPPTETVAA